MKIVLKAVSIFVGERYTEGWSWIKEVPLVYGEGILFSAGQTPTFILSLYLSFFRDHQQLCC